MDKKTIMQTMVGDYHRMSSKCKRDIGDRLSRMADRFYDKEQYIERSKQFWDDISDERIAREQERCLACQRKLAEIVSLMEDLEYYLMEKDD